jgi:hypothetical protein
MAALTQIP